MTGRGETPDADWEALEYYRKLRQQQVEDEQNRRVIHQKTETPGGRVSIVRTGRFSPELLGLFLKQFAKKNDISKPEIREKIDAIWYNLVGSELAKQTRPVRIRNGILTVEVFSPTIRQELENFYAVELLQQMQDRVDAPTVLREIRFQLAPDPDANKG